MRRTGHNDSEEIMASKELATGFTIASEGQINTAVHVITQGTVKARFSGGEITLKKGDVIGLCDIAFESNFFTYTVDEPAVLVPFPCKSSQSIKDLCSKNTEIGKMMFNSMVNQVLLILTLYARTKDNCSKIYGLCLEYYDKYISICAKNNVISRSLPQFDSFSEFSLEEDIDDWLLGYYASFREFTPEVKAAFCDFPAYIAGFIKKASTDIHAALSVIDVMNDFYSEKMGVFMQESGIDMFDLFTSLLFRLKHDSPDAEKIKALIESIVDLLKTHPVIDTDLIYERVSSYRTKLQAVGTTGADGTDETGEEAPSADLSNSLDKILEYGDIRPEQANMFRELVTKFKKLSDKTASDDNARKIRLELSKLFYDIYLGVLKQSFNEALPPPIIRMFLNFGYVDEELAGGANANYLYSLAKTFSGDASKGIYTASEWLRAVYTMKKDPSRNEFDTDYLSKLHELKVAGKISAEDEIRLSADPDERLKFEIENMFPMVNKVTYGRLSVFCPVFSEHNIIKPLSQCLVTIDAIEKAYEDIKKVDYGAFYRETVYTNEKAGIPKEFVAVEVMPNIILMPNVGTRAVMWQEIEGRKRTTPARFMISVFHMEDIYGSFVRLVGEYRWEMCKRVQGARWNDVSDRSLTSEYFDYIQFYKKNNELSQDAKEKIKTGLVKAKNSFKEMFVRDYIIWVIYEGTGSPRLNKVVRSIMCTYCPFPAELRQKMASNPLFKDTFEHYEVKIAQKIHHLDNVIQKLKSSGVEVPQEIAVHRNYIEGK